MDAHKTLTDVVFDIRQQQKAARAAQAQFAAVARVDLPMDSDSDAVFRAKTRKALSALCDLAAAQKKIVDAATRVPDFPRPSPPAPPPRPNIAAGAGAGEIPDGGF